jgi:predicted transcriptional regulator
MSDTDRVWDGWNAAIEEGIRDADAGRLIPHADVVAWVRSWGTPDELPMPAQTTFGM